MVTISINPNLRVIKRHYERKSVTQSRRNRRIVWVINCKQNDRRNCTTYYILCLIWREIRNCSSRRSKFRCLVSRRICNIHENCVEIRVNYIITLVTAIERNRWYKIHTRVTFASCLGFLFLLYHHFLGFFLTPPILLYPTRCLRHSGTNYRSFFIHFLHDCPRLVLCK